VTLSARAISNTSSSLGLRRPASSCPTVPFRQARSPWLRRVPVQDAHRQRLRQRQLPCGARQGAVALIDLEHWRTEKARPREQGRHIAIGIATTQERSVFSSTEFWFWFD
jgi:hypothetical protein